MLTGLLDPRRSLTARLVWMIVLVSLLLSLLVGWAAGTSAKNDAERAVGSLQAEYARQLADQLDDNINDHMQIMQILAGLVGTRTNADRQRALLAQFKSIYTEYAWIGLANMNGKVIAATDDALEGQDVSATQWFTQGKTIQWVDDLRNASQLTRDLPPNPGDEPLRYIDVAAPAKNAQGDIIGVLGGYLGWVWVNSIEKRILAPLRLSRDVETLIIGPDGEVMLGPGELKGTRLDSSLYSPDQKAGQNGDTNQTLVYQTALWPDGVTYLTGIAREGQSRFKGLGWTVLVRERADTAFAPASQLQWRVLLLGLGLGLLAASLGVWLTRQFTQPLNQIAVAAERIQNNRATEIPHFKGQDEVSRVSRSLRSLVNSLEARNRDLQTLNATLEDRVRERTSEIERLSLENQQAAVVRERLRMARDLHDTLTHTLAEVLTQIRLTRKVAQRNPQAVANELALAELAAQQGLQEARIAITNLRVNPVHEMGLATAMERQLNVFAMQHNIHAQFQADATLPVLSDERAETMYRIFEEALRNIEKHARAANVHVSLQRQPSTGCIVMSVCDDGIGFDPATPFEGHYGLHGMHEQCDLIHARLNVASAPGHGTQLDVTML